MTEYLSIHWLDITTTILGIAYIVLEYRASILLWIIGIVMPAMDIYLYWSHGLYGDAGMAVYYTVAAIYGYAVWKFGRKSKGKDESEMPITHFPKRLILKTTASFFLAWGATYYLLKEYTGSTVPMLDAFTNAMSCYLYIIKGIPFKAGLYGMYVIIAVMGYMKWKRMAIKE